VNPRLFLFEPWDYILVSYYMMKVFSTEFEKYYHLNPESFLLSLVSVFYYVSGAYFLLGSENISYSALEVFFPKLLKFFY